MEGLAFQEVSLMSPNIRRTLSPTRLNLAKTKAKQCIALTAALLLAMPGMAQQPTTPPDSPDNLTAANKPSNATASIPAGTRLALVLTQPIQTRHMRRGDDIFAQTTSPVTSGNEVVIPAGTFVQGKFDKLERQNGRGELRLQALAITFPDGYVAPVAGPITLETDEGYTIKDPSKGRIAGAFALPAAGAGIGALIGHSLSSQPETITSTNPPGCTGPPPGCLSASLPSSMNTLKSTAIGSMVGLAAGGIGSFALLFGGRNFYLDAGSPASMVLHQPIVLPEDEVADAIRDAAEHPEPVPLVAPRPQPPPQDINTDPGICYTPGTPGTPDVDIPGIPAIGDSPGTPPIHIPGIPATPPTPHPCP